MLQSMQKADLLSVQIKNDTKYNDLIHKYKENEHEFLYQKQVIQQLESKIQDLQANNDQIGKHKI
jgi:hypothetical protein